MTLTTSCEDQLDIEQKGVIPSEKFYQTDADAEVPWLRLMRDSCVM